MLPRRRFLILSTLASPLLLRGESAELAGRRLVFRIGKGFGDAPSSNIEAVLRSAAESIWSHCPHTRWENKGFSIYLRDDFPIMNHDHSADGWLEVGLTTKGTFWAQLAYQFAHEFCHALAGHSNDWRKPWIRARKANHWLEESLCETASLFALRSMGRTWVAQPPYPNWKSFAPALTSYAQSRLDEAASVLPAGKTFAEWFRQNEASLRSDSVQRDKNTLIASRLLPLFENNPSGWESLPFFNLGSRQADKPLAAHLSDWKQCAPEAQRPFVGGIGGLFA